MPERPTIKQMLLTLKNVNNIDLQLLLDVVLGVCEVRGLLAKDTCLKAIDEMAVSVFDADPEACKLELSRMLAEVAELGSADPDAPL